MAPYPPSHPLPEDMHSYAVVITDMWNTHWCTPAAKRVAELAPRINEFVTKARSRGALIIHAPSDTMGHYNGAKAREWILNKDPLRPNPKVQLPSFKKKEPEEVVVLGRWNGCEEVTIIQYPYWKHEIDTITIDQANDAISDNIDEIYSLLQNQNRRKVLILGVHLNQCVLSTRSFSLNTLVALRDLRDEHGNPTPKLDAVHLVRDLTDTMYATYEIPFIDHFAATDVVAQYIEQTYERPSRPAGELPLALFSSDLLPPYSKESAYFRFEADHRPEHREWSEHPVQLKCLGTDKPWRPWLKADSSGVSLVQNQAEATRWELETFGRSMYFFKTPDNRYLDADTRAGDKAVTTSMTKGNGTRWWVEPVILEKILPLGPTLPGGAVAHEPVPNAFWLRCCNSAGSKNYLDGNPTDGTLTLQRDSQPRQYGTALTGTRWEIHLV